MTHRCLHSAEIIPAHKSQPMACGYIAQYLRTNQQTAKSLAMCLRQKEIQFGQVQLDTARCLLFEGFGEEEWNFVVDPIIM